MERWTQFLSSCPVSYISKRRIYNMLKSVLTGLVASALVSVTFSASASAASQEIPTNNESSDSAVRLVVIADESIKEDIKDKNKESENRVEKRVTKHTIKLNENLSEIAKKYDTTWQRIFFKNESVKTPDLIEPGAELVIPTADEKLEEREIPLPPAPEPVPVQEAAPVTVSVSSSSAPAQQTQSAPRQTTAVTQKPAQTSGNGYVYGYCTWHVKNLRSDLPNNLGNADTWAARASAQGYSTGSTPRVGAVAQAITGYMHVAYVTAVHKDGTITVSEMNFKGWGVVNSRSVSAKEFVYIY